MNILLRFFMKTAARPAIAMTFAVLVLATGVFCHSHVHAASLTITGGRESGEQAIGTFIREDNERIRRRQAERDGKWNAAGPHLAVDCSSLMFPAEPYCRSGECSGFSGAARELCAIGTGMMYDSKYGKSLEYIATFVEHGTADVERFGRNKYAALNAMNMSRQARLEFAVYHLSGLVIQIWGDDPIRMFNP